MLTSVANQECKQSGNNKYGVIIVQNVLAWLPGVLRIFAFSYGAIGNIRPLSIQLFMNHCFELSALTNFSRKYHGCFIRPIITHRIMVSSLVTYHNHVSYNGTYIGARINWFDN